MKTEEWWAGSHSCEGMNLGPAWHCLAEVRICSCGKASLGRNHITPSDFAKQISLLQGQELCCPSWARKRHVDWWHLCPSLLHPV